MQAAWVVEGGPAAEQLLDWVRSLFAARVLERDPDVDEVLARQLSGASTTIVVMPETPNLAGILLGLRTAIYPAPDLQAAKAWLTTVLGLQPYFDTDFYVGFAVAGYELALDPHADPARGVITYWGVAGADTAYERLVAAGAVPDGPVQDVGDGIRTAVFTLPHGAGLFGVIENPHFQLPTEPASPAGPGR